MQDERLAQLQRQRDVPAQVGQLVVARGEGAVVVQARLADGRRGRVARQVRQLAPCRRVDLRRHVRVRSGSAEQSPSSRHERQRGARRRHVPAGHEHACHAREARRGQHLQRVAGERVGLEVGVRIDLRPPRIESFT